LYCSPAPDSACRAGAEGNACENDDQCQDELLCGPTVCQAGGEGDDCADESDCDDAAPFCGPDGCQVGAIGDACDGDGDGDDDCAGALLCGPDDLCQAGVEGDSCDVNEDCGDGLYCAEDTFCYDGSLDDPCNTADDCDDVDVSCVDAPGLDMSFCNETGFVRVAAGTFNIGCPPLEGVALSCQPNPESTVRHSVTLTNDFVMLAEEVTVDAWDDLFLENPSTAAPARARVL
jgi:hypothetical protein